MAIPKKVSERMIEGLKRLLPVVQQQRTRDVSEADTVTLVKDFLADVFGYDKYSDLTGEFAIRGTFCDLAVRLDDKICELIEVKAIGVNLNQRHLKQAVDYAANQGIEWMVLTNGMVWQLHRIEFSKPIDVHLVATMDVTSINLRKEQDLELAYAFTKEGFKKGVPAALSDRQDATSRFLVAALLLNNQSVRSVIRRELRRVVDVNVMDEEIVKVLETDVIKRDALEGPDAQQAAKRVRAAGARSLRSESTQSACSSDPEEKEDAT